MRLSTALLTLSVCLAQDSSVISLSNGIRFRITQHREGSTPDQLKVEMKPASGNSFYRIFQDQTGLAVYAYEIAINRLPDGSHFQIVAKPAGNEFAAKFPNADGGKPTPTLAMPMESPPLGEGGQFTVEIPTNPGFFEHRSDVIQVQPDLRGGADHTGVPPPPLLRFAALRVFVNGKQVPSNDPGRTVVGQFAMFYIPHRGGFFFSTQPGTSRPFAQIGTVDRLELKFSVDNEDYQCLATSNILTQSERGQIWVFHDPNYKPEGSWTKSDPKSRDEFFTAASDSLGWWLP
jgi:hypothetical protein